MNQIDLIDAAKQQQGLTSDYKLAQALGITTGRISDLQSGRRPADEAEIMMLADMAKIEPHVAFAAVHKDKEKNPAKRAYWERISLQFAVAGVATIAVAVEKISGNFESLISRCTPRRSLFSTW
ncbi:hypothetical protein SAMN04515620_1112 [Collimonas sp. OK607]|uniref:hypothetical protein n=1 Tax=Collimonas sp. OK607 TaxID=1798194 RepID=UPI0008E2CFBE|nr:hypothetical protein [Collimonas sp. OK607]SFA98591.1 hypothetical protein SAMN04515620_1112 [Collimonas sp. OK607]